MNATRYEGNPLVTPADVKPHRPGFEVIGAFNAGVARLGDEIRMLLRVAERPVGSEPGVAMVPFYDPARGELATFGIRTDDGDFDFSDPRVIRTRRQRTDFCYLTSLSHIRLARSKDGLRFKVDDEPFLFPSDALDAYGVEDARVTQIGDTYYIYYSAVSKFGIGVAMVSTHDFVHVTRHGMIFGPDNKDVLLFPRKIGGKYYALHRPTTSSTGSPEMWIAESDNLLYWGNHRHLLALRPGMWDSGRIGGGAVPIETERGWLELYHGADEANRYCMGAVLFDLDDPSRVVARSAQPILEPVTDYERNGFFGDVVFSCGAIVDGDRIRLYYGVADTSMACADISLQEIMEQLVYC